MKEAFLKQPNFIEKIFGTGVELLPSVTELFEFEMAFMEYNQLDKSELIDRGAFFKRIEGKETMHYKTYSLNPKSLSANRSSFTKAYFENGQFSTGYATHSLFPYRGKFHPQLIKGLLNIIGIKKGELVLDPMSGSGTTNIEASLLGIDSLSVDVSPFCQFMDFIIPNKSNPYIIAESSYLVTISSGQGNKSKTEVSIDKLIKEHYPNAKFIGFVDGIGWYVRKGDLKRMVSAYEDVFTFHRDELKRFREYVKKVYR